MHPDPVPHQPGREVGSFPSAGSNPDQLLPPSGELSFPLTCTRTAPLTRTPGLPHSHAPQDRPTHTHPRTAPLTRTPGPPHSHAPRSPHLEHEHWDLPGSSHSHSVIPSLTHTGIPSPCTPGPPHSHTGISSLVGGRRDALSP